MNERRLVFTSAGDRHRLHPSVVHGAGFDLMVYFFGSDHEIFERLRQRGGTIVDRKGGKFPNLLAAYRSDPELFDRYDAVFIVDDDLALTAHEISHLFEVRREFDLWIVQPSFDPRGRVSYRYSMPQVSTRLRFTNFVETNAPLFSSPQLKAFMDSFNGELGGLWGTDWWYMSLLGEFEKCRYGISDEVITLNPEARDGMREIHRLEGEEAGLAAWREVKTRYSLREIEPFVYSGVSASYLTRVQALARRVYFFISAPKEIRHRQLPLWAILAKRKIRDALPKWILQILRKS